MIDPLFYFDRLIHSVKIITLYLTAKYLGCYFIKKISFFAGHISIIDIDPAGIHWVPETSLTAPPEEMTWIPDQGKV
jgi:hypothetical protein